MTHYEVLGVDPAAPAAEVRQAYVALARLHHPDRAGGDASTMRAVNAAWATLSDPGRRALYDRTLGVPPRRVPRRTEEPGVVITDAEDLAADLEDDTPLGGRVVLPRWISLAPVGVFVASVGLFFGGMLFGSAPVIGVAASLFILSCAMFLAAPFVALLSSRRPNGERAEHPPL